METEINAVRRPQLQSVENGESDAGSDAAGGEPGGDDGNEKETEFNTVRQPQLQSTKNGEPSNKFLQPHVYYRERVDQVQMLQQKSLRFKTCQEYDEKKVRRILKAVTAGDKLCKVCNRMLSDTYSLRGHI